ncbi:uncharacterized protein LOC121748551 [Salvia splendens]|uniref:uncharacterized protein LOC121748551 n=1 Tax=Salvia splendens TaxID=180675 RepID=UPI001100225F|nr:uncharacterized protein LOC121748551 [Salvia splendens]
MESLNKGGGGGGFILKIHVHHARNIHNICIYEKQDVYAKFSLTYDPDHTISTPIIRGGGRNPDFNEEDMAINVTQADAVLKCEIWMLSRAKHLMDDQLLGFALLPISSLSLNKSLTQDFHLSSTDLFHSPAGTIKLSLLLNTINTPLTTPTINTSSSSHDNDSIILVSEDYCRMEFPDVSVADQNRQMVTEYFAKNGAAPVRPWDGSFLHLGAGPEEYENSSEGSSSGMTSLSDDRNTGDSIEEEVMQKQIVEMYVRSMQQFTESLAKMKLPMDLDKDENEKKKKKKEKDSSCSRVFYGSRAFF